MKPILEIFRRVMELERRQANLLRVGTVRSVGTAALHCVVALGRNFDTAPIPWLTFRAGDNARTFAAPSIGEQVLVLAPLATITAVSGMSVPGNLTIGGIAAAVGAVAAAVEV